jgi:hypothetical protein
MKITTIFYIIGLILFILGFSMSLIFSVYKTKNTDCYDGYKNKIIGQTCLENYLDGDTEISHIGTFISAWGSVLILFTFGFSMVIKFLGKYNI